MVILPKKYCFHGKFLHFRGINYKIPMHLRKFFFHALDTITQPVLGKFPIKVKISMTISNSTTLIWVIFWPTVYIGENTIEH
jgi:hypothetical protein